MSWAEYKSENKNYKRLEFASTSIVLSLAATISKHVHVTQDQCLPAILGLMVNLYYDLARLKVSAIIIINNNNNNLFV